MKYHERLFQIRFSRGNSMEWETKFINSLKSGPFGQLKLLINYGSNSELSDSDYFAVYDIEPKTRVFMAGAVDLWLIGEKELDFLLPLFDPFVSEPILTGSVLYDLDHNYDHIRTTLENLVPTDESINYLVRRSFEAYIQSINNRNSLLEDDVTIRMYWSNITFSIAYWYFAKEYSKNKYSGLKTLDDIVASMPKKASDIWYRVIDGKKMMRNKSVELLNRWTELLLSN